jgi:hypothetical protein
LFNSQNNIDLDWLESNNSMSANDVVDADTVSPYGNTNKYQTWIISANKYAGIYLSTNSGSSWTSSTVSAVNNNFSSVLFGTPTASYVPVYIFDDTNSIERGSVFYAEITASDISAGSITWVEKTSITGIKINSSLFNGTDIWACTDNGIYISTDGGVVWTQTHLSGVDVLQVEISGTDYYAATADGCYVNLTGSWVQKTTSACYTVHVISGDIYIGTDNGMLRSTDAGNNFYGDNPSDSFYPYGLSKAKTTYITSNSANSSEIFVAQHGGVFISENSGGNFQMVSNLLDEKRVTKLLLNSVTNSMLYAVTETIRFSGLAITFLIDFSGSMEANDPQNRRLLMAKKIINGIEANYPSDTYFQIIYFGVEEKNGFNLLKDSLKVDEDFMGAEIQTSINGNFGFLSSYSSAIDVLDAGGTATNKRTPLWDSIEAMSEGLNKYGVSWTYDSIQRKYIYKEISPKYFSELRKTVVIITDGHDTVTGKSASDLASQYANLRSNIYIAGIGLDINYDNLFQIKEKHSNAILYIEPFNENICRDTNDISYGYEYGYSDLVAGTVDYLDIAEIILDNENSQKREGTWKKTVDYSSKRYISSCQVNANVPENTVCKFRIKTSSDRDVWSSWSDYNSANSSLNVSLTVRYIQIEVYMSSDSSTYSPEVSSIVLSSLTPSESEVYFTEQTTNNRNTQIHLSSVDSTYIGDVTDNEAEIDFTYIPSESHNLSIGNEIYRDTRSMIRKRDLETTSTTDGYFYYVKNGSWNVDDITDEVVIYYGYEKIDPKSFVSLNQIGAICFYERQTESDGSYKIFEASIPMNNSYRIVADKRNSIKR